VQSTIPLAPVTINTMAVVKNAAANIVYIQLEVLPFLNNAPSSIYAQFVLVVQQQVANVAQANRVNVWAQDNYVYVALTYNTGIPTTTISLILNSNVLDDLYRSMGYTTSNAFVQVSISNGLPTAPDQHQHPHTRHQRRPLLLADKISNQVYSSRLNSCSLKSYQIILILK
jgi:hypothetical protein